MTNKHTEEKIKILLTEYCQVKYKHEQRLKKYKKDYNVDLKTDKTILKNNDISIKLLNYILDIYLNTHRLYRLNLSKYNDKEEISLEMYKELIYLINNKTSLSSSYYDSYKSLILNYFIKNIDKVFSIKKLKETQYIELRIITKKLIEQGFYINDALIFYKKFKIHLKIKSHGDEAYALYKSVYNDIKDDVRKDMLEIYKTKRNK